MCIQCRKRLQQNELFRLQLRDGKVERFNHIGRSFYLCPSCIESQKTYKHLVKRFKLRENAQESLSSLIKEIVTNG